MIRLDALIARNMGTHSQNLTYLWCPLELRLDRKYPVAWLRLPNNGFLTYRMDPDYDERLVASCGPFSLTRPETAEEQSEREDGEAEAAWEVQENLRYTEWYY